MRQVLITGAAGFIGSHLCDQFLSRGYDVVGVDNLFRGSMENLADAMSSPRFTFAKIDLAQPDSAGMLNDLINQHKIQALFHLAAINGTQYFYDESMMVLDVNVRTTQSVMAALAGTGVTYLAYTSSSEVYGDPTQLPTPESHPLILNAEANRDSYASSKAIGDFYVRIGAQKLGIDHLILRVFNQYGPRMVGTRYGQVVGEFVTRLLNNEQFTIIGDGLHTRSFCLVTDCARAMVDLYEKRAQGAINIGDDREISVLDLARLIHEKLDRKFKPVFLPERPHDHRRRCPDITRLKAELPRLQLTSLDRGLDLTITYYRQNLACV